MTQYIFRLIYLVYSWPAAVAPWLIGYLAAIILSVKKSKKEQIYSSISRIAARTTVDLLGIRIELDGVENVPTNEPVVFVSNHQSLFDIPLAFAFVPNNFSFISKESVFRVPLVGPFMKASGHIGLERTSGKKAYETMVATINKLETGKSLVVFPEGTRSVDGKLGSFKRGISLIISQSGKKVVPMAIVGSGKFLPKDTFLSDPQNRDIKIRFGKPFTFEKKDKVNRENGKRIVESIKSSISDLLSK